MSRIEEALRKAEQLEQQERSGKTNPRNVAAAEPEAPAEDRLSRLVLDESSTPAVAPAAAPPAEPRPAKPVRVRGTRRSARAREFYDKIRANIQLALPDQQKRTLAVCSSLGREGTTTTAVHLALSMAEQGPTLLIDANLIHAELHQYFQVAGRLGLADYLDGAASAADVLVRTSHPNLGVVILGALRPRTAAQLCSDRLRHFFEEMRETFDAIVLDCAPLEASAETPLCAAMTDGVVLVVRAGRTRREIVQHSTEVIHNAGARCVGVVLNQMRFPIPSVLYDRL